MIPQMAGKQTRVLLKYMTLVGLGLTFCAGSLPVSAQQNQRDEAPISVAPQNSESQGQQDPSAQQHPDAQAKGRPNCRDHPIKRVLPRQWPCPPGPGFACASTNGSLPI